MENFEAVGAEPIAYQRRIRETLAVQQPRAQATSLRGYHVETISRADALPIILRYEYLGTLGRTSGTFVGLVAPNHELEGVACFGYGPSGGIRQLIGEPALCLERGACVHYAPSNAASFLITHACKLVYRMTRTSLFFAYADPEAGEYGAVYQASNWVYLGQGLNGREGRALRYAVLPPGADRRNPANWKTTRILRRPDCRLSFAQARILGYTIAMREAKHVYAVHVGRERRAWRARHQALPYPAPMPMRKLKQALDRG